MGFRSGLDGKVFIGLTEGGFGVDQSSETMCFCTLNKIDLDQVRSWGLGLVTPLFPLGVFVDESLV